MKTLIRRRKTVPQFLFLAILFFSSWQSSANGDRPPANHLELIQQQVERYTTIVEKGGWITNILPTKKALKPGQSSPVIRQLKQRLQASGEFTIKDTSSFFTPQLEAAVKKAQRQFGFIDDGIVDAAFIQTLNVPAEKRLEQLKINLERLQAATLPKEGKRIVVNIPAFTLSVYEGNEVVMKMNVVVGKPSSKTEVFDDELTTIVFSPYWNVPVSIVRNELLPAMRRNRRYLSAHGYEITGYEGGLPVIRQKPGEGNSLGLVKFLFPNHHAIYFHDTPAKSLFKNRVRASSHGCIRLAEPARLAEYLLKDDPSWTPSKIGTAMFSGKEQWVKLSTPVPVYITYYTAWIDQQGELQFRDDIYQLDHRPAAVAVNQ